MDNLKNTEQYVQTLEEELAKLKQENRRLRKILTLSDKSKIIALAKAELDKTLKEAKMCKEQYTKLVHEAALLKQKYQEKMERLLSQIKQSHGYTAI